MTQQMVPQDWLDGENQPISCTSKLRVLRENEAELRQVLYDACADALLMGVGQEHLKQRLDILLTDVIAEAVSGEAV